MRRWIVSATRPEVGPWPWPTGYFPRGFAYKANAIVIRKHVERLGGTASVKRADKEETK